MSFVDAQKLHLRAIVSGPFGEMVTYCNGKSITQRQFRARVRRETLDTIDGMVKNHLLIRVSKEDLSAVFVHDDAFIVSGKRYTVMDVIDNMTTHWLLECALA